MSLLGGWVDERAMLLCVMEHGVWIGEMILESAMKKISSRSSDMIAPHFLYMQVFFFHPMRPIKNDYHFKKVSEWLYAHAIHKYNNIQ